MPWENWPPHLLFQGFLHLNCLNKSCHVSIFAKGFPPFFYLFFCFGEPRLSCSSVRFNTVILQLLRCEIFGLCWPNNRWLNKRDTMYFCRLTAVSLIVCHPPWQQQQTKQRAAGTVYFWRLTRKLGSPRFPLTKSLWWDFWIGFRIIAEK